MSLKDPRSFSQLSKSTFDFLSMCLMCLFNLSFPVLKVLPAAHKLNCSLSCPNLAGDANGVETLAELNGVPMDSVASSKYI